MRHVVRLAVASVVMLSGCVGYDDASAYSSVRVVDEWPPPPATDVDVLLMIDNSCSLGEEQASVIREIPRIATLLTDGDPSDLLGLGPQRPFESLHIGIIDSDMGLGDVTGIATCEPGFGDDGVMQMRAHHPPYAPCEADYGARYATTANVFAFEPASGMPASAFAADVGCVAYLGTDGCGFEMSLEATLKALAPAPGADGSSSVAWTAPGYRPPVFWGGRHGHGNDPATNGVFLRPDSLLAIVVVTDEDDTSTDHFAIFSPDDPAHNGVDLNLRSHAFADELFPIARYADGLVGLRVRPERLVFAAIAGLPPTLSGDSASAILADPLMAELVNPAMPNQLLPACSVPGRGVAYPAIRIVQLVGELEARGAHTTAQSICNDDFGPAFTEILRIAFLAR
jgi:hypothetical protein